VEEISLASTTDIMKDIMVVYATMGKSIRSRLEFKSDMGKRVGGIIKLDYLMTK
jgi:hypothetical protein